MITLFFLFVTLPLFISTFFTDEELNEAEEQKRKYEYDKIRYKAKGICLYSDAAQLAQYHNQIWRDEHEN